MPLVPKHCLYTSVIVETVKLNFHLDLYATLDCYLNSGLGHNCKFSVNLVSHKALTDTRLPWVGKDRIGWDRSQSVPSLSSHIYRRIQDLQLQPYHNHNGLNLLKQKAQDMV
jgi:hypothetical protein